MFGSNNVAVGPVYLSVFLRSVSQKGGSSGQTPGHFLEAGGTSGILFLNPKPLNPKPSRTADRCIVNQGSW